METMPSGQALSPAKAVFLIVLSSAIFATIGVILLLQARTIAKFYRDHYSANRFLRMLARSWPWEAGSSIYESMFKIGGVFMLGMAVFLLYVMIQGLR